MKWFLFFYLFSLTLWGELSFDKEIQPLLQDYCFDCHGDGSARGNFSMDEYDDLEKHLNDVEHWLAVWRNLRSQIMPPPKKDQPDLEERKQLLSWIEEHVFKLDPAKPDPGRVTIRRLNRVEYHYAIQDLLGVNYKTWEDFPADDTGYGFDTIGDVLSISPLHLEKYLAAASRIVEEVLPEGSEPQIPVLFFEGKSFQKIGSDSTAGNWLPFKAKGKASLSVRVPAQGDYQIALEYAVRGSELATDQSAHVELSVGGVKVAERLTGWDQRERITLTGKAQMLQKESLIEVAISPREAAGEGQAEQAIILKKITLKGPLDGSYKEFPESYRAIMAGGEIPQTFSEREMSARKIMQDFASRAFRRPLDRDAVSRLVRMVLEVGELPGKRFEDGIKHAMTAILASPRFLFRAEIQPEPDNKGRIVLLDEYALASRLSFFLWSSVPDEELLSLASRGELRADLRHQVERMLASPKSRRFVNNFVGQWLQARDLESIAVDVPRVLGLSNRREASKIFNSRLRQDMRRETELFFDHVLKSGRPAEELISARYSFLNERLAKFYEVPGVHGDEHRYVDLSGHPQRGGILGQGTFLIVTSNPTRTSPVKRGLFVLDNLLGTPAPPAPPDIPELEEVAHANDQALSMRQMMEIHREKPLCASCHRRMDPIGLGLENFNAIGQFRTEEKGVEIDAAGVLITGEKFDNVEALKDVLANDRRDDFYRCLSEKVLTYALGRGLEYYDAVTIDYLVDQTKENGGSLKALLVAVIESAAFQKRRGG